MAILTIDEMVKTGGRNILNEAFGEHFAHSLLNTWE